jgi:hypothetical protein
MSKNIKLVLFAMTAPHIACRTVPCYSLAHVSNCSETCFIQCAGWLSYELVKPLLVAMANFSLSVTKPFQMQLSNRMEIRLKLVNMYLGGVAHGVLSADEYGTNSRNVYRE